MRVVVKKKGCPAAASEVSLALRDSLADGGASAAGYVVGVVVRSKLSMLNKERGNRIGLSVAPRKTPVNDATTVNVHFQ